MPIVDNYAPGAFCWAELATTDTAAAKAFYSGLLDWDFRDQEMGGDSFYSIITVGGQQAAGMYGLTAEQKGQSVPPHWMVYFSVTNADQTAAKATALGGKIIAGPFPVHDLGRMAMLEDPTGAKFCIWQPSALAGAAIVNELGVPTWPELATRDPAKAAGFYTQLLGWDTKKSPNPLTSYTEWQLGGESIGGMIEMDNRWGGAPPHWLIYIMVSDCRAASDNAVAIGGKVHMPPMDIPNVGQIAVVADPQGAVFSMIQLAEKQT
jgi:predicted enzyme related to lactoylglutathione lyase